MNFKESLHNKAQVVEKHLATFFNEHQNEFEKKLHDSMKYSLLSGGKRIRPILALEIGRLFGAHESQVIDYACAIEMIHTYSLIHDDLPAMDDDDLRRGKKTNHIVYGEAMAILAGDGLLNYAFELMSDKAISMNHVNAMKAVSKASGHQGMIGGQVADIMSEDQGGDADILHYIQMNKTSALLTCALLAGGHIAGADDKVIKNLERLGACVGIAFQIKDDILDIESDEETLGKPIGSDEKNKKLTYPSLHGLEASKEKLLSLTQEAHDILDGFSGDVTFLKMLVDYLCYRNS
ncbi:polyprenyl synthetase family protein [Acidaminobacter sp. JC074]|uniref:polyprenyl synthetase family protein n=1 Tax=Acidaminobacter sp. JC074 TaxID=2530199 RepID=UPI001F119304|nr:farnesyl diphosphate synthase [Acidaminobacter sp. JC074]MCH4888824.1 polyprenyl synthetase family protein [Acidaminobacter sp. JC074]